jgi:hypothetical protein
LRSTADAFANKAGQFGKMELAGQSPEQWFAAYFLLAPHNKGGCRSYGGQALLARAYFARMSPHVLP